MALRTWNNIQKEIKAVMLNVFSLVKLKLLLIKFCLICIKILKISCCFNFIKNCSIFIIAALSNWSLKIGDKKNSYKNFNRKALYDYFFV